MRQNLGYFRHLLWRKRKGPKVSARTTRPPSEFRNCLNDGLTKRPPTRRRQDTTHRLEQPIAQFHHSTLCSPNARFCAPCAHPSSSAASPAPPPSPARTPLLPSAALSRNTPQRQLVRFQFDRRCGVWQRIHVRKEHDADETREPALWKNISMLYDITPP